MVGLTAVGIGVGTFCFFWWQSCRNTNQNIDSATEVNINNNRIDVGPKIEIKQPIKTSPNCDCNAAPDIKSAEKPPRGSKEWYDWMIREQGKTLRELQQINSDNKEWMRKYCPEVLEDNSSDSDNSRD